MLSPKCTIWMGWTGPVCGLKAVRRNRFGGFECQWHSSLCDNKTQPDSYFNLIVKEIGSVTFMERMNLRLAYWVYKLFGKQLWKKTSR